MTPTRPLPQTVARAHAAAIVVGAAAVIVGAAIHAPALTLGGGVLAALAVTSAALSWFGLRSSRRDDAWLREHRPEAVHATAALLARDAAAAFGVRVPTGSAHVAVFVVVLRSGLELWSADHRLRHTTLAWEDIRDVVGHTRDTRSDRLDCVTLFHRAHPLALMAPRAGADSPALLKALDDTRREALKR